MVGPMRYTRAFGMIELIVSIAIFAMVTGLLLANFRQGERNDAVRLAVRQVAEMLRKAQNAAAAGLMAGAESVTCEPGLVCGFGVAMFLNKSPIYFLDANRNNAFETGEEIWGGAQNLPTGVTFTQETPRGGELIVLFMPPYGRMEINNGNVSEAKLSFNKTDGASQSLDIDARTGRISY